MSSIEINRFEIEADVERARLQLEGEMQEVKTQQIKAQDKKIIEGIIFNRFCLEKDASPSIRERGKHLLYSLVIAHFLAVLAIMYVSDLNLILSMIFYAVSGIIALHLSAIYLTGLHNSQRKIIHNLEKATNRNALSNDASIRAGEALSLYKNKLAFAKSINDDEIILKRLDKQYFDEMISSLLEGI